jgi:hypothetical protein
VEGRTRVRLFEDLTIVVTQADRARTSPAVAVIGPYGEVAFSLEQSGESVSAVQAQPRRGRHPRSDCGFTAGEP